MKKINLEVQQVTYGEDDIQSQAEAEKVLNDLGRFQCVETVDKNTYRICLHELEQSNGDSGYYWIDVKVKGTES